MQVTRANTPLHLQHMYNVQNICTQIHKFISRPVRDALAGRTTRDQFRSELDRVYTMAQIITAKGRGLGRQVFFCVLSCTPANYLDRFTIARQRDIAERLAVQQRRQHPGQIRRMVVPAQAVLLVHVAAWEPMDMEGRRYRMV